MTRRRPPNGWDAIADARGTLGTSRCPTSRQAAWPSSRATPRLVDRLESALAAFGRLELPLDAARARIELARALEEDEPEVAAREARAWPLEAFERLGATREADEAAALVTELGGPARTGPKARRARSPSASARCSRCSARA